MKRPWLGVLLVEDDALVIGSLRRSLARFGAHVTVATTLESARRRLLEGTWDGVVCDVYLPDGCALDLLEKLPFRQHLPPTLVQSAVAEEELTRRAFLLGAHFVYKPFGETVIRRHMSRVRAQNATRIVERDKVLAAFARDHHLTAAEQQVLVCLMEGKTYEAIAAARGTTHNTCKAQVRSILQKTDCHSTSEVRSKVFDWAFH